MMLSTSPVVCPACSPEASEARRSAESASASVGWKVRIVRLLGPGTLFRFVYDLNCAQFVIGCPGNIHAGFGAHLEIGELFDGDHIAGRQHGDTGWIRDDQLCRDLAGRLFERQCPLTGKKR